MVAAFVSPAAPLRCAAAKSWHGSAVSGRQGACTTPAQLARSRRAVVATVADRAAPVALPRPMKTTTHTFRDPRGREWTYEADVLSAETPSASRPGGVPVIVLHTPSGLGVNRTYWDRLLSVLCERPEALRRHPVARLDWVGTGATGPKPDTVERPYDAAFFAAQLAHFAGTFGQQVVLVAQGASEVVAIRVAVDHPEVVRAVVVATGLGKKYVTQKPNELRRNFAYSFFKSAAGKAFWGVVNTRRYITGFSRKNLLVDETWLEEWVSRAVDGAVDDRIRFNVFSFIAGFLFGDYSAELRGLGVPYLFLAGTEKAKRNMETRFKSARPPAPLALSESSFREQAVDRMRWRCEMIPGAKGAVVEGAGFEMFFEQAEVALPFLEEFIESL